MTSMEREEKEKVKKREKKLEDEETLQQATWVKYTFPVKHQVNRASPNSPCSFGRFPTLTQFLLFTTSPEFCSLSPSAFTHLPLLSRLKVWKQKGEEYRVTGYGGWSWISKTYVPRFAPRLPGNTNANYRKELEGLGKQRKICFF